MQHIKNIIFDLGGVFIDIHYQRTEAAFEQLGISNFDQFYQQDFSSTLFEDLETGKIAPENFYNTFREVTQTSFEDNEIATAWNAMIGDFRTTALEWLDAIAPIYNIFLYSNTNKIHHDYFTNFYTQQTGRDNLNDLFKTAYYSHEFGYRKPYPSSYIALLNIEGILAEETLFIDDTLKNIIGASEAGLQTIHLLPPMELQEITL